MLLQLLFALCAAVASSSPLRPPCTPLNVASPYQSTWSCTDNLYDSFPEHWAGGTIGMASMVSVDGVAYRIMGPDKMSETTIPSATQTSVTVGATTTTYTFDVAAAVALTVSFMTPAIDLDDDDKDYNSYPASYITYSFTSSTAADPKVRVYFDTTAESIVSDVATPVTASRPADSSQVTSLQVGAATQNPVSATDDRIAWGYQYVSFMKNDDTLQTTIASSVSARNAFANNLDLPSDDEKLTRPCDEDWMVLAGEFELVKGEPKFVVLTLDQTVSMDYYGSKLYPFWQRNFDSATELISSVFEGYESLVALTSKFDKDLYDDLSSVGGSKYADLLSLVYRQVTGSLEKTYNPDVDETWVFMKEISSDGDVSTVDVVYPAIPMFLYLAPETFRRTLLPIFNYANNATGGGDVYSYSLEFAPHHLGVWPVCAMKEEDQENMPVEESSNMLIMLAALAKVQGSDSVEYLKPYIGMLKQWADFNIGVLPDPGDQLCTDDFEGPSPHNVNLAAKGIVSLGAFGQLLGVMGDEDGASHYRGIAEELVGNWTSMGVEGGHSKLQYDLDDSTWSLKYNLLFDQVLELGLFDYESLVRPDLEFYKGKQNTYGVPLDNRATFTKTDWEFWIGAMDQSEDQGLFNFFVESLWKFADETVSRVPLSDWIDTVKPEMSGFQARPVMGGLYAKMLLVK